MTQAEWRTLPAAVQAHTRPDATLVHVDDEAPLLLHHRHVWWEMRWNEFYRMFDIRILQREEAP